MRTAKRRKVLKSKTRSDPVLYKWSEFWKNSVIVKKGKKQSVRTGFLEISIPNRNAFIDVLHSNQNFIAAEALDLHHVKNARTLKSYENTNTAILELNSDGVIL